MSIYFERELQANRFLLQNGELECNHLVITRYLWYVQDCTCCSYSYYKDTDQLKTIQSKDFPWFKYSGCVECMNYHIGVLNCGGHYSNFRIYKVTEEEESNYGLEVNLGLHQLNANEYVYAEDD